MAGSRKARRGAKANRRLVRSPVRALVTGRTHRRLTLRLETQPSPGYQLRPDRPPRSPVACPGPSCSATTAAGSARPPSSCTASPPNTPPATPARRSPPPIRSPGQPAHHRAPRPVLDRHRPRSRHGRPPRRLPARPARRRTRSPEETHARPAIRDLISGLLISGRTSPELRAWAGVLGESPQPLCGRRRGCP